MAESNSYEEQRRRQVEENRRKLEELRLHHLSAAVREAAARPRPKPKPTIPKHFIEHLPAQDEAVVLVDEADEEFHMLYTARHHFLRKGWRGFAAHHDLADGDCLVFQLTDRTKFKVYIIRASSGYGNDKTSDDEDEH